MNMGIRSAGSTGAGSDIADSGQTCLGISSQLWRAQLEVGSGAEIWRDQPVAEGPGSEVWRAQELEVGLGSEVWRDQSVAKSPGSEIWRAQELEVGSLGEVWRDHPVARGPGSEVWRAHVHSSVGRVWRDCLVSTRSKPWPLLPLQESCDTLSTSLDVHEEALSQRPGGSRMGHTGRPQFPQNLLCLAVGGQLQGSDVSRR